MEKKTNIKKLFKLLFLLLTGLLFSLFISSILIIVFKQNATESRSMLLIIQFLTTLFAFGLPPFFIWKRSEIFKKLSLEKMSWRLWVYTALLIAPLTIIIAFLGELTQNINWEQAPIWLTSFMDNSNSSRVKTMELLFGDKSTLNFIFATLVMALTPALFEELFFRGALQRVCLSIIPKHIAIVLAAFIFSLIHFDFYNFPAMLALSLALGYLCYYTASLWPCVAVHFVNNFTAIFSVFYLGESINPKEAVSDKVPFWCFVLSLFAVVLIFYIIKKTRLLEKNNKNT